MTEEVAAGAAANRLVMNPTPGPWLQGQPPIDPVLKPSPRPVVRVLSTLAVGLFLGSVLGNLLAYGLDLRTGGQVRELFQLDAENSVPTWFATVLLLLPSVLFAVIGFREDRYGRPWARHWWGLAVVFVVLSILEGTRAREDVLNQFGDVLPDSNLFRAAWIIPLSAVLAVLVLVYARFLRSLATTTRRHMLLAAALFLFGAVVLEVVGNLRIDRESDQDLLYYLGTDVEEAFEMAGVIVLISVLMRLLEGTVVEVADPGAGP